MSTDSGGCTVPAPPGLARPGRGRDAVLFSLLSSALAGGKHFGVGSKGGAICHVPCPVTVTVAVAVWQ